MFRENVKWHNNTSSPNAKRMYSISPIQNGSRTENKHRNEENKFTVHDTIFSFT